MVELMFAVTIFSLVAAAIYVTLITLSKRVESINVLTTATSKVALFEKEFGYIVMPSQTIEFRDGSGNPYTPPSTALDSDRDEIFFNVLNSSLNWVWMRIWYDSSTSQIWLDPNISGGSNPVVLLKDVERFDYMSAAIRGNDPIFTIKVALGGDYYVSMNICYLMDSVSTIEKDPIRLRITKRLRN